MAIELFHHSRQAFFAQRVNAVGRDTAWAAMRKVYHAETEAPSGDWTHDRTLAKRTLYQLSYRGIPECQEQTYCISNMVLFMFILRNNFFPQWLRYPVFMQLCFCCCIFHHSFPPLSLYLVASFSFSSCSPISCLQGIENHDVVNTSWQSLYSRRLLY